MVEIQQTVLWRVILNTFSGPIWRYQKCLSTTWTTYLITWESTGTGNGAGRSVKPKNLGQRRSERPAMYHGVNHTVGQLEF